MRSGSVAVVLAGPVLVTFAVLVAPVCVLRGDNVVFSADGRVNMVVAPIVAVPEVVAVVFDIVVVPHVNLGGSPSWQLHTPSQVSHSDGHLGLVVVVVVVAVVVMVVVLAFVGVVAVERLASPPCVVRSEEAGSRVLRSPACLEVRP